MILTAVVNFETVKLLKDKEFENKNPNKLRRSYYNHLGEYKGDATEYIKALVRKEDAKPFESVDAPTIGQVVDWLFEKHGIWVFVKQEDVSFQAYIRHQEPINNWFSKFYDSPKESYEAAITYCLEKLI
jgi:hypothetical protein